MGNVKQDHKSNGLERHAMLTVDPPVIRQRLFSAMTASGSKIYLAFLMDGGCAIVRDDKVIAAWEDAEQSLEKALDHFLQLTSGRR
jgi:hypothetical protein